ncbi:MAG: hypothetical protein KGQ66_20785 [Acidobacteriota bacterium]|nr:hypothetical protein [Acidobacteriota bacterium]
MLKRSRLFEVGYDDAVSSGFESFYRDHYAAVVRRAAGVIGIALFGAAWLAGVVGTLGSAFNIATLRTIGSVSRGVSPTDGMWQGATHQLEPATLISTGSARRATASPTAAAASPPGEGRHRPRKPVRG